jgi:hypothetical protein
MRHTKIVVAAGALVATLALGVGQASAHGGRHAKVAQGVVHKAHQDRGIGLQAAATYLGVSVDVLQADLKAGQSLAQVADATAGKSSAGLIAALTADAQAKLDAAVAAGKLTAAQEQALSARLTAAVTKLVNATRPSAKHD